MSHPNKTKQGSSVAKKGRRTVSSANTFQKLCADIRKFTDDRDWEQFHSPKNLSMALIAETAELLEHFLWLTEEQSRNINGGKLAELKEEIGDVLIYLIRIADQLGIDLLDAAGQKLCVNARKYPVKEARGNARKYTELKRA